jgi:hypothetical protein
MWICVKCGREQGRRSWAKCEYDGNESAGKEHAWEDRGEFIDELHEKLPPFIKERIAALQKKYTEKQALSTERLVPYSKRRDELQAAYAVYLNEGLPRVVEKKKQRAIRSLLRDVIGWAIGVLIIFKWMVPWIFSKFSLDEVDTPYFILPMIVLVVYFLGKSVAEFLKARRYAESQALADELAREWLDNNGFDEVESNIKAEKYKWNNIRGSFERVLHDAERALVGSDEELLNFYIMDKQTKNWYLEKIYEGEW